MKYPSKIEKLNKKCWENEEYCVQKTVLNQNILSEISHEINLSGNQNTERFTQPSHDPTTTGGLLVYRIG